MAMQINYMVKVKDAKLGVVRKALSSAGIEVVSLVEVFKQEDAPPPAAAESDAKG